MRGRRTKSHHILWRLSITISGLKPGEPATLTARTTDKRGRTWQSSAVFAATDRGTVDVGALFTATDGDEARYERYADRRDGLYSSLSLKRDTGSYLFAALRRLILDLQIPQTLFGLQNPIYYMPKLSFFLQMLPYALVAMANAWIALAA